MNIYFKNLKKSIFCYLREVTAEKSKIQEFELIDLEASNDYLEKAKSSLFHNNIYIVEGGRRTYEVSGEWVEMGSKFSLPNDQGKELLDALSVFWPFMPGGKLQLAHNPFCKIEHTESITFYGGSFNPWHRGHLECLLQCPAENIVVVPDFNPWKKKEDKESCRYLSFIQIYNEIKNHNISIYPGFWAQDTPNPTVDWVQKLNLLQISLLVGDDNFMKISEWKKSKKLLSQLSSLYVLRRNFERSDFLRVQKEIEKDNQEITILYLEENPYKDLSSSQLRKALKV